MSFSKLSNNELLRHPDALPQIVDISAYNLALAIFILRCEGPFAQTLHCTAKYREPPDERRSILLVIRLAVRNVVKLGLDGS